jgi:hypothetical protein
MKSALLSVVMFYADSQNLAGLTAVFRLMKIRGDKYPDAGGE